MRIDSNKGALLRRLTWSVLCAVAITACACGPATGAKTENGALGASQTAGVWNKSKWNNSKWQ